MLYGIRQTEKRTNTVWYPFYVESKKKKKKVKLREAENRTVLTRGWGLGEKGRCWPKGTQFM